MNPIYEYLSSNGLTDLSEDEFLSEYSTNTAKRSELYSYMSSNNLTDLSEEDFTSKYLPKKKDQTEPELASSGDVGSLDGGEAFAEGEFPSQEPENRTDTASNVSDEGFFGNRWNDIKRGLKRLEATAKTKALALGREQSFVSGPGGVPYTPKELSQEEKEEMAQDVVDLLGEVSEIPISPNRASLDKELQDIRDSEKGIQQVFKTVAAVASNPGGAASLGSESLGSQLPFMPLALAAAPIASVAGAGKIGSAVAFAMASGVSSMTAEEQLSYLEALEHVDIDPSSADQLEQFASDPEKQAEARQFAAKRGLAVGLFDMVTGFGTGMIGSNVIKNAAGRYVARGISETVGASAGEATAQGVTKGEIDLVEVTLEGVLEQAGATGGAVASLEIADAVRGDLQKSKRLYSIAGKEFSRDEVRDIIRSAETTEDLAGIKIENDKPLKAELNDKYESIKGPEGDRSNEVDGTTEPEVQEASGDVRPEPAESTDESITEETPRITHEENEDGTVTVFDNGKPVTVFNKTTSKEDVQAERVTETEPTQDEYSNASDFLSALDAAKEKSSEIVDIAQKNINILSETLDNTLKSRKVDDVRRRRLKQTINFFKKAPKKDITEAKVRDLLSLVNTITRDKKLNDIESAQSSIRKNIKNGKLGEKWKNVLDIISEDIDYTKLDDDLFDAYHSTVTDLSKKLRRGTIAGNEISAVLDLEKKLYSVFDEVTNAKYWAEQASMAGIFDFNDADSFITQLTNSNLELSDNEISFIKENMNVIESLLTARDGDTAGNRITFKPELAVPYFKQAGKLYNEALDEGIDEEGINEYVLSGLQEGVPGLSESLTTEEILENENILTQKASEYALRESRSDNVKSISKDFKSGINFESLDDREKDFIASFTNVAEDDLANFSNSDLQNFYKVLKSIESGVFIPPIAKRFYRKINGIRKAKAIREDVHVKGWEGVQDALGDIVPSTESKIAKLINSQKETLVDPGDISKAFSKTTLSNLPWLGRQVERRFMKLLTEIGSAAEKFKNVTSRKFATQDNLWVQIKDDIDFNGKKWRREDVNVAAMMYMLERQFYSNPRSKTVPRLKELVDTKIAEEGASTETARVKKLWAEFNDENNPDHADVNGLKEFISKAGGENYVNFLEDAFRENQKIVNHNIKYGNKAPAEIYENYVPLITQKILSRDASNVIDSILDFVDPAVTKSKTSQSRKKYKNDDGSFNSALISFDLHSAAKRSIADQAKAFYLREPYLDAIATMDILRSSLSPTGRAIVDGMKKEVGERMGRVLNQYQQIHGPAAKIYNTLSTNVKKAILAAPLRRLLPEMLSNMIMASIHTKATDRIVNGKMISDDDVSKITDRYASSQAGRLTDEAEMGEFSAENDRIMSNILRDKDDAFSPVFTEGIEILNKTAAATIGQASKKLITTPDKLVSKNMWKAQFSEEFESRTGIPFDQNMITDPELSAQYNDDIKEAISSADELVTRKWAGSSFFVSTERAAAGGGSLKDLVVKDLLNFFIGFRTGMTNNNLDAIRSLIKNEGSQTKEEAAATLASNAIANISYTILSSMVVAAWISLLKGDDSEETEEQVSEALERGIIRGLAESSVLMTSAGRQVVPVFTAIQEAASILARGVVDLYQGEDVDLSKDAIGLLRPGPYKGSRYLGGTGALIDFIREPAIEALEGDWDEFGPDMFNTALFLSGVPGSTDLFRGINEAFIKKNEQNSVKRVLEDAPRKGRKLY